MSAVSILKFSITRLLSFGGRNVWQNQNGVERAFLNGPINTTVLSCLLIL